PNRARRLALRALEWEVRRRAPHGPAPDGPLPVDARILAVQPDHLGGVLAATPAFRLIKETLPTCVLTVLAGPWGADAAEHCPAVDRVRTCRFPAFDRQAPPRGAIGRALSRLAPYERALSEAAPLRAERFDLSVVLVPDFWSSAVTALAGVPRRIGFEAPDAAPFLTLRRDLHAPPVGRAYRDAPREHGAAAQMRLARDVVGLAGRDVPSGFDGRMAYEPTAADRAAAVRLWRAHDLDDASAVVALHPSPGGPSKRWSAERWAVVANHVTGRFGARVMITGGPGDVDEARAIAGRCARGAVVLAGQTTFGALAALLERCRFALGTDNGAMHLATARGTSTLRLFGPVDAGIWSGWTGLGNGGPITISLASPRVCSPCHRLDVPDWRVAAPGHGDTYPCMTDITVDHVVAAVERLWQETDGR
ncbi:MAG TPA: glycosyltransferase family 9 protein, partial [Chloroflexota bacterium]|nr:glycosyltransferase family 9 protein [Chloroflexota bacterium]